MPTLASSQQVLSASADNTTLVSSSFTANNGDVFVVGLVTWDTNNGMAAPTGGGQSWIPVNIVAPGGFNCWCAIYAVKVTGSPGSFAVTAAPATGANTRHSMKVERWTNANLAGSPATNATTGGNATAPSASITTTGANSALSWVSADINATDPAGRAYLLSATEDLFFDGHAGSNSEQYGAYAVGAAITTAGAYTIGMSAPTTQHWVMAGVEILDGGSPVSIADVDTPARGRAPRESVIIDLAIPDAAGSARGRAPRELVDTGPNQDRAGSTRGRGPTETVSTTSAQEDQLVAPTLRQVLACMATELAEVPSPPAHYRVVPNTEVYPALGVDGQSGATVLDECCEGVAWVRLANGPYPSAEFPAEEAWYPDFPTSLAITVEMGVLRCGGGPGVELAPTDAQWGADAQAVEDDKAALRRAYCCIQALIAGNGTTLMQDVVYGPGRWEPAQGEGNCMGGSLQVTIQLPYCCG